MEVRILLTKSVGIPKTLTKSRPWGRARLKCQKKPSMERKATALRAKAIKCDRRLEGTFLF